MFAYFIALAALPYLLVQCVPANTTTTDLYTSTYIYTQESSTFSLFGTCTTLDDSTGVQPTPLPTSYSRATYSITTTAPTTTVPTTVYVTANTTTATSISYYSVIYTTVTSTFSITTSITTTTPTSSTIGTATSTSIICTNSLTAPVSTVTEYTGTPYTPVSGQTTAPPASFPTLVTCTELETWLYTLYPTEVSGVTTVTHTPATTASIDTIISTQTFTSSVYATTIHSVYSELEYVAVSSIATISTSCAPTTTTTYAEKCAPTNLISAIDGLGITLGEFTGNSTIVRPGFGAADTDPSLCCQVCVDNEGCAAMLYFAQSSACFLAYTDAACEEALTYTNDLGLVAGEQNIVQAGCGTIEQVDMS